MNIQMGISISLKLRLKKSICFFFVFLFFIVANYPFLFTALMVSFTKTGVWQKASLIIILHSTRFSHNSQRICFSAMDNEKACLNDF